MVVIDKGGERQSERENCSERRNEKHLRIVLKCGSGYDGEVVCTCLESEHDLFAPFS